MNVVRYKSHRFNFADIKILHMRFRLAASNIRINGGHVQFNDRAFNERHTVDQIQIGIPFIGDLPAICPLLNCDFL